MPTEERTYVIDPGATDPDLIRSISPLGESVDEVVDGVLHEVRPRPRPSSGRRESIAPGSGRAPARAAMSVRPPARPIAWLVGAYALGPFSLVLGRRSRPARGRWLAATAATLLVGAGVWIWTRPPETLGSGDRAILLQTVAVGLATVTWLAMWMVGLLHAARRCVEGPLARRTSRRPAIASLVGLLAPGLGLLLAGRRVRSAIAVGLVGAGGAAGLMLGRAPHWWAWHRSDAAASLGDLALEVYFLVLAGLVAMGILAWLISALEAGRLTSGPRVVRAISGADRVPAAFLLALVAFVLGFRPLETAQVLDRMTTTLAAHDLRLIPLWSARAAARIAPFEPGFELRVAEREAALGHDDAAAAIQQRLRRRWERLDWSTGSEDPLPTSAQAAAPPSPTTWQRPTRPSPLAPPVATASPPPNAR